MSLIIRRKRLVVAGTLALLVAAGAGFGATQGNLDSAAASLQSALDVLTRTGDPADPHNVAAVAKIQEALAEVRATTPTGGGRSGRAGATGGIAGPGRPTWKTYEAMNDDFVSRFINTTGFGVSRMGPMRMQIMQISDAETLADGNQAYIVGDVELMGVARHNPPVVFISNLNLHYGVIRIRPPASSLAVQLAPTLTTAGFASTMPAPLAVQLAPTLTTAGFAGTMPAPVTTTSSTTAAAPPTRPLNTFEQVGLNELNNGRAVVVLKDGNNVAALGAIRAQSQCINCHSEKKVGDILGAFSYTLVPAVAPAGPVPAAGGRTTPANAPPPAVR